MTSHAHASEEQLARARLAYISAGRPPLSGPRRAWTGPPDPEPGRAEAEPEDDGPPQRRLTLVEQVDAQLGQLRADDAWRRVEEGSRDRQADDTQILPRTAGRAPAEPSARVFGRLPRDGVGAGAPRAPLPEPWEPGDDDWAVQPPGEKPGGGGPPGPPEPDGWLARALDFCRQHAVALGILLLCGVAVAVMWLTRSDAAQIPAVGVTAQPTVSEAAPETPATPQAPQPTPKAVVRVHVLGAVQRPGVVKLPGNAIVQDAVLAAGGMTADADPAELNLAAAVADGQQIVVGTKADPRGEVKGPTGAPAATPGAGAPGTEAAAGALVNINTASAAELESLPGVGPVLAGSIIAWREEHGGFKAVAELQEVSGIGPKVFAKLEPLVTV